MKLADIGLGIIAIGVGLSIGLAGLGSGIGQGTACSSAVGATAEDPEFFGQAIVFGVLPETQAVYGLVIAFMLMFILAP